MSKLQSVCADIPILTSATQDMHAQITHLLLEAQGHMAAQTAPNSALAAAAAHGNVGPMTSIATGSMMGGRLGSAGGYGLAPMPQRSASPSFGGTGIGRSGSATVHSNAAGTVQVMRLGSPTGTLQQQLQQQQLSPLPRSPTRFGSYAGAQPHMLHSAGAVSPTYPAGLPTGVDLPGQGGLQGWQQPGTAAAQQPLLGSGLIGMYEDVLAMSKSGVPLPVIELQTRAYELGYKVESIENDLR